MDFRQRFEEAQKEAKELFQQAKDAVHKLVNSNKLQIATKEFKELIDGIKNKISAVKMPELVLPSLFLFPLKSTFTKENFIALRSKLIESVKRYLRIAEQKTNAFLTTKLHIKCANGTAYKFWGALGGVAVCIFALTMFLMRPTVEKVQEMKAAGDLQGLNKVVRELKDTWLYDDVRMSAIKALVEVNTCESDIVLNRIISDYKYAKGGFANDDKKDMALLEEIKQIRKDDMLEAIKKDSLYVNKKLAAYIDYAGEQKTYNGECDAYYNLQETFKDLDYELEVKNAIAANTVREIKVTNEIPDEEDAKTRLEYVRKLFEYSTKDDTSPYKALVNLYFDKAKEVEKLGNRDGEIDRIIDDNLNEKIQIENFFRTSDDYYRNQMRQIYLQKGINAALEYQSNITKTYTEKIDRYYEIDRENNQLRAEQANLPQKLKELKNSKRRICLAIRARGSKDIEKIRESASEQGAANTSRRDEYGKAKHIYSTENKNINNKADIKTGEYQWKGFSIKYPIVNLSNVNAQDKINDDIYARVKRFLDHLKEFPDYDPAKDASGRGAGMWYKVTYEDDKYLSIRLVRWFEGIDEHHALVYDKRTGNLVPLSNFINITVERLNTDIQLGEAFLVDNGGSQFQFDKDVEKVSKDYLLLGNGILALQYYNFELGQGWRNVSFVIVGAGTYDENLGKYISDVIWPRS
ncbi:MAG: hypothetical protein Q4E64_06815 [Phascolarctobacterium sp.]|uniref:hypothetical protein n=1 Tax=Phascolarctobacterium sp. TaxID=2049039 RepID=UPI0026DCAD5E|nr:hypothetical protein [Phascolarctobacterium sp.]MDO4921520.1 hypothetical protein [Phascolarctobacterium sp.]